jgi:hypothetical protein
MRKMMLLATMVALAALMLAATPAMADDDFDREDFCDVFDCNDRFDHFDFDDGFSQSNEQEADSGDVDQSFEVSGGGDNSNQTVGLQGVANTGNAQNQFNFTDFGNFDRNDFDRNDFDRNRFDRFFDDDDDDDFDPFFFFDRDNFDRFDDNGGDFEFEDSGASIEVSPINTTSSDQEVNQAASAFGR